MKNYFILFLILLLCHLASAQEKYIALTGGAIIDVTHYGTTANDIPDAVVVIRGGKIIQAGARNKVKIPSGAQVIDVTGKYIVPGLIDAFSVLNNQGQANAHLYMGVTTIGCGTARDERRGDFFPNANPGPRAKLIIAIPDDAWDDTLENKAELSVQDINRINYEIEHLDSIKKAGYSTITVHHRFPEQLMPKLMKRTKELGMSTIGEMQYASYASGLKYGVNSFVHTSRYILEAMPDSVRLPLLRSPNDSVAGMGYIKSYLSMRLDTNVLFEQFARGIASSHTALMPTLSMLYSSLPDHKNLWKEPIAVALNPKDIWLPMDTATGKSTSWVSEKEAFREQEMESAFHRFGAHYITGSGADAFGAMPGISEHIEIEMLHNIGLTNREAIAAATNNVSIFNGWNDVGLIEAGRYADILVLSADPLQDLGNLKKIDMVWLNGVSLDLKNLLKR